MSAAIFALGDDELAVVPGVETMFYLEWMAMPGLSVPAVEPYG